MGIKIIRPSSYRSLRRYLSIMGLKGILSSYLASRVEEYFDDQIEFRLWYNCEGNALRFELDRGDYCYSDITFSINGAYSSYDSLMESCSEEEKYQYGLFPFSKRTLYTLAKTSLLMCKQGLERLPDHGIYHVSRYNDHHHHGFNSVLEQFGFVKVSDTDYIRFPSESEGYGDFNRFGKWLLEYSPDDCLAIALYLVKTPWLRKLTIIE